MAQNRTQSGDTSQRMFDLNRPQGYAKDDYLWQWKVANDTVFNIIQKSSGGQNTRDILYATMFAISLLAHDDIRRREEMLFHAALDHIERLSNKSDDDIIAGIKDHILNSTMSVDEKANTIFRLCHQPQMSADKKMQETVRVCAITMGNLTSYVDQFRGLAHTLKVGELVNFEKPYYGKKNAFDKEPEPDAVIEL